MKYPDLDDSPFPNNRDATLSNLDSLPKHTLNFDDFKSTHPSSSFSDLLPQLGSLEEDGAKKSAV